MSVQPHVVTDEKADMQHVESTQDKNLNTVQLKSELDTLSWFQTLKLFRKAALICTIAGLSAATDGYQAQLNGNIIANKGFVKQFSGGAAKLNPTHVSTFGGGAAAGQIIGQFSIQYVADGLGRKAAMWTMLAGMTLGVIIESVAHQWWHWTIAKIVAGAFIGAVQATLPVYISEHAPAAIRGALVVAYSMWWTVGGLMASVALKVHADKHPLDFRTPIYTQYGMLGLCFLSFLILPESPWWLISKGKLEKAEKVLNLKYKNVPGYDIAHEMQIIEATIQDQRKWDEVEKAQGAFAIFKGLNLKRFLIGCWPKVLQQLVGMAVFSNYLTYFFQLAGNKDPFQVNLIVSCVNLLAVGVDAALVDRIGRRRMTLIGFTGAGTGVLILAIVGCFDYTNAQLGSLLVFAGVLANFCNNFQSSTSYAYLTEMPEQRFRARATGWGLAWCNCFSLLFSFTVPIMLEKWVVKTAFLFVCTGIPGIILAYFIMPESARRTPAEIHEMFVDHVPLRKWRGYKTSIERDLEARTGVDTVQAA